MEHLIDAELENLSPEEVEALIARVEQKKAFAARYEKLENYTPYEWQRDFHNAGKNYTERMLMAANRVGKTQAGAAEVAFHLTGLYPDWWEGIRFSEGVLAWTGSPTNETSKDIVQDALLGSDLGESLGTGFIPKELIVRHNTRQAGVKDVVDTVQVRHVSGDISKCILKTYEQGWKKWQGTAPHVVWLDEEPDEYKIFSEAQTRVLSSRGVVLVTFTPLQGHTELVMHFEENAGRLCFVKGATWDDAPHLGEQQKNELRQLYRAHEVDARTKGIPMLGAGAIFPIPEDTIKFDPIEIPPHWARIKGVDFGNYHNQATVDCAWDRDADVFWITNVYRARGNTALPHAMQINSVNSWVPVAWPHDGGNTEKGSGRKLVEYYREHQCNMLKRSACYPKGRGDKKEKEGSLLVEPVIDEVMQRMITGRWRVFSTCTGWFEEFRSYHRDDNGKVVDRMDDALKASFYALIMRRYAISWNEYSRTFGGRDRNVFQGVSTAI